MSTLLRRYRERVDLLADLLSGARAQGGILNQTIVDPPYSIRIADRAPLTLVLFLRGISRWTCVPTDLPRPAASPS